MEGLLYKWTNYWSGWQLRWFILDDGVLSYYTSQDDVGIGCKGSVKMSVCDVLVNPTDQTRLDLVIPGEQHFFIKASNAKERQQWLVALGSCKATQRMLGDITYHDKGQKIALPKIKQKKSELRIYCDLLMQQVHSIKQAASEEPTNVEAIEQSSLLLSETCDTFIHTLESCMGMLEKPASLCRQISFKETTSQPSSPVSPGLKHLSRSPSPSVEKSAPGVEKKSIRASPQSSGDTDEELKSSPVHTSLQNGRTGAFDQRRNVLTEEPLPVKRVLTFFDTLPSSFIKMTDLEEGVKTKQFIDCARSLSTVFDKLSVTAFAPVKNDFIGNIKKIEQKWITNPNSFTILQSIVKFEVSKGHHTDPNSATQALLWLTRGLLFLSGLLEEMTAKPELYDAVSAAYERTLKPFHNFVVKGIVSIALRAMPYKSDFVKSLADDPKDVDDPELEASLNVVTKSYITAVLAVCEKIKQLYMEHNIIVVK